MTIGWPPPEGDDDDVAVMLEVEMKGQQFTFAISRYDRERWQVHVIQMPACASKRRSLADDKLNLVTTGRGKAIWIATEHLPRNREAARDLARLWAKNILLYFAEGTRFWFPRDNDW